MRWLKHLILLSTLSFTLISLVVVVHFVLVLVWLIKNGKVVRRRQRQN